MNRRQFFQTSAGAALTSCASLSAPDSLIIDTHQHLWDRRKLNLPWLGGAPEVLRHDFLTADYQQAFAGLNVKAIYMEVDVAPDELAAEAEHVISLAKDPASRLVAAVIGGLHSYPVAAVGALFVGLVEAFGSFWASAFKEVIVFTLILPILVWRSVAGGHTEEH